MVLELPIIQLDKSIIQTNDLTHKIYSDVQH